MDPHRQVFVDDRHPSTNYEKAQDEILAPLARAHDTAGLEGGQRREGGPDQCADVKDIEGLRGIEQKEAAAAAQAIADSAASGRTQTLIVMVLGIGIAVGLGLFVARTARPRRAGCSTWPTASPRATSRAASGLTTDDELGRMGRPWTGRGEHALGAGVGGIVRGRGGGVVGGVVGVLGTDLGLGARRPRRSRVWCPRPPRRSAATCRRSPRARRRWVPRSGRSPRNAAEARRWRRGP